MLNVTWKNSFTITALTFLLFIVSCTMASASSNLVYGVHVNGSMSAADANTYGVINYYPMNSAATNFGLIANPAGTYVYVSDGNNDQIKVVNPSTNSIVKTISLNYPAALEINSAGDTLYACMPYDNKVAVIDLKTFTVKTYITVGNFPWDLKLTPDDSKLYVANYAGASVSVISTVTNTVTSTLGGYDGACAITISKDGAKAFILEDFQAESVAYIVVLNTQTDATLTYFPMDYTNFMGGMDIEPSGTHIWITCNDGNTISGYNVVGYAKYKDVTLPTSLDNGMHDLHVSGNNKVYVTQGKYIRVYDINTNTLAGNITYQDGITMFDIFSPSDTSVTVNPQLVTFTTKTFFDTIAVTGLDVSVYDNTNALLYTGVTDSTGTVNFVLTPTTPYRILFNQSPNINTWYNITPSNTGYIVSIPFGQVAGLTSWSSEIYNPPGDEISWKLVTTYNSTTGAGSLTPTYNDTGTVTSVTFSFYQNATNLGSNDQFLGNQSPAGSGSWTYTENLESASGNGYYIIITVVKPSGTFTHVSGLACTFPGPAVLKGVFPADWYFWIAWGVVMCFYGVGTVTKKGLFACIAAAAGFIFTKWGWYSLVYPDIIAYAAICFTFVIGIVVTMIERERYT